MKFKVSIKQIISVSAMLLLGAAVIAGIFFGSFVRKYYPGFSTMLFISSVIFFGGIAFAIVERNIVIGIVTVLVTMLVPFIAARVEACWENCWECLCAIFPF